MGELLNLVGLSTGVVLYTMLLVMVLRAGRALGPRVRVDLLLLATALLGLVWNVVALPAHELPKAGFTGPFPLLVAAGFSALGFLPAVVVHSVLRGGRHGGLGQVHRWIVTGAYSASAVAAVLHLRSAWVRGAVPSTAGMQVLTFTFVALIVPVWAVTRRQPGSRRTLWIAALAIFAVSALHLSRFHQGDASWWVELIGHHASLPLAVAILYQDYPFALADLFLKRALALLAVVTFAFLAIALFGATSSAFGTFMRAGPRQVGVLVTLCVATALLYPLLRRVTAWFVDAVILRRPDYRSLRRSLGRRVQSHEETVPMLGAVADILSRAIGARTIVWREWPMSRRDEIAGPLVMLRGDADELASAGPSGVGPAGAAVAGPLAALVIVPTSEAPRYAFLIGELTGGRRLLSDDVAILETVAVVVARRVDAIRIRRERYERELREQEMGRLATEAELRALRAQINPHFLFNALTTIGHLIQTAPSRALETLLRLTALLRVVLGSEIENATLGAELDVVEAYLAIEHARFEDRLHVTIDAPPDTRHVSVPPLVLQPLVENAVRHGIAPLRHGGDVTVRARLETALDGSRHLSLLVRDTGAGATEVDLARGRARGVGLRNVERRLACQYGDRATMCFHTTAGAGTTVELHLPAAVGATGAPVKQVAG
jgi:two-component system LytT family sensor kinase